MHTVSVWYFDREGCLETPTIGRAWCNAVYNATGLIYEPTMQTCLFDDSWPGSQGHRQLGTGECEAVTGDDLRALKEEIQEEFRAHTQEAVTGDDLRALKEEHTQELKK